MKHVEQDPPKGATKAGYAALAEDLGLDAPLRSRTAVSGNRINGDRSSGGWTFFDNRVRIPASPVEHIDFALRREPLDLLMLKKAFQAIGPRDIESHVRTTPTGVVHRKVWFLYEWLTGQALDLPDHEARLKSIDVLDPTVYHAASRGVLSQRHRVIDNLPGTPAFCPLARRSGPMSSMTDEMLSGCVSAFMSSSDPQTIRRAAANVLLGESRSSHIIGGERPSAHRLNRWASTLAWAGQSPLSSHLLNRLQAQIVGEGAPAAGALRRRDAYLGSRDGFGDVVPEHIGARHTDLPGLMEGIFRYDRRMVADEKMNPMVHAAGVAFGMAYVHPYEDGNGRIHRYLINHVLAVRGTVPGSMVLPVSTSLLGRTAEYEAVMRAHSDPILPHVPWYQDEQGDLVVEFDSSDLYRYPDVTLQAGFLHACVMRALEHDLPGEVSFVRCFDRAKRAIDAIADMPGMRSDDLISAIRLNENAPGTLPARHRRELLFLDDATVARFEQVVREAFDIGRSADIPRP